MVILKISTDSPKKGVHHETTNLNRKGKTRDPSFSLYCFTVKKPIALSQRYLCTVGRWDYPGILSGTG